MANRFVLRSLAKEEAKFTKWVNGGHEGFPRYGLIKLYDKYFGSRITKPLKFRPENLTRNLHRHHIRITGWFYNGFYKNRRLS